MLLSPTHPPPPARRLGLQALLGATSLGLRAKPGAQAAGDVLRFGVGLYQPGKEKKDATYRPLAAHLARQLGRRRGRARHAGQGRRL